MRLWLVLVLIAALLMLAGCDDKGGSYIAHAGGVGVLLS